MSNSSLTVQMQEILDECSSEIKAAANNAADKVARKAASTLRNTSPKKSGDYAKGWTVKKERGTLGINTVTVHNKTNYQLTHLLENGHIVRNAKGTFGRAPAHKHIEPVEQWASEELPREIERQL